MKKIFAFFHQLINSTGGQIVLSAGASVAINQGGQLLHDALEDFYAKKPKEASALVASLYVWADTSLEDLVKKSKTTVDDQAVLAVKKELEEFAAAHGFTLSNVDAD